MSNPNEKIFSLVDGDKFFLQLVEIFYEKVAEDDILRSMFPDSFVEPKENLFLFLRKIFGGPDDYTSKRGHPMMRRRHLPFPIGLSERNRWIKLMLESLEEMGVTKSHPIRAPMEEYFQNVATHMINREVTVEDINSEGKAL